MTDDYDPLSSDPFGHVVDDDEQSPQDMLNATLDAAKRGWVPLRKTFVQRPKGSGPQPGRTSARASVLSDFVRGRHQRALDLFLLLHAFQPILDGSPLKLGVWATILSTSAPCSSSGVSRAVETLEEFNLVRREGAGHSPNLRLLREDGEGGAWAKPGLATEAGPGYFVLPHEYWTTGLHSRLTMPGKAVLLISLAETQNPSTPSFKLAYERAADWYGISERTVERGFGELSRAGLLLSKRRKVADRKHPAGRREETWRALETPFSTAYRAHLQSVAKSAAQGASRSTAS